MDPSALDTEPHGDRLDPLSQHHKPCQSTAEDGPTHASIIHSRQERNRHGWRRVVVNFTPSWFAVTMGTGITSILLERLPYNAQWLHYIAIAIFVLNICIFVTFSIISATRYLLFRGIWSCMLEHPVQSLFLGTVPMGLATIINMIVFVCVPTWGYWAAQLAWALWWVDVVLALATNLYLPFIIMSVHKTQLQTMTAVWLLPIVAPIVTAASGAIVASALQNNQHALWTILISYIIWGLGVPLAMFTLVIYFQRLTIHKLPPREVIVSVFLPLGPLGQGSFAIMELGNQALRLFPKTMTVPAVNPEMAGQVFYICGLFTGLLMWGFGIVWLFFALASISRSKFPFNLGWWGFTFPLGVYAVSTVQLSKEIPSLFFKVLGTIFSLAVVCLWIVVSVGTIRKSLTKELFVAPCIKEWENQRAAEMEEKLRQGSDAGTAV